MSVEGDIHIELLDETKTHMRVSRTEEPDFLIFVLKNWDNLKKLPEYQKCEKIMSQDEILGAHLNKLVGAKFGQRVRITTEDILRSILVEQLRKTKEIKFSKRAFNKTYFQIEEFFYNDKLKFCVFAPIENFQSDVKEIRLGDGLRIVKISEEKLKHLWKMVMFNEVPDHRILSYEYVLERVYETDKAIGDTSKKHKKIKKTPNQETKELFNSVISALRIFKEGSVGYTVTGDMPLNWQPCGGSLSISSIHQPLHSPYILKKKEIYNFKKFWRKFRQFSQTKYLDIAIRRFNFASERRRPEDKLIDYMISFESLFLGLEQELGLRLSLRVARLVGKKRNRKEIFQDMKTAYDLRSKFVHGATETNINKFLSKKSITLNEFVSKVEEYLRKSIKQFINLTEQGFGHEEIIRGLDEDIC